MPNALTFSGLLGPNGAGKTTTVEISPSCPMSRQIQERLIEHRRPEATLLLYKQAGHRAFGVPLPPDHPRLAQTDVIAKSLNEVLADSLKHTLAFLKAHLSK